MRSPKFIYMLAALAFAFAVSSTQAARITLPAGTNWHTATPDQIREAVFNAVQKNPDKATEIVTEAIEQIAKTGRFPRRGVEDGKQVIDPRVINFEDIAEQIGQAATSANPAQAAQIAQAVHDAIASTAGISPEGGGGGGGGGWEGGGGVPPPLPGGWGGGGGGGGTGGGSIYSN